MIFIGTFCRGSDGKSALKTRDIAEGLMERDGYETERDELEDLMR